MFDQPATVISSSASTPPPPVGSPEGRGKKIIIIAAIVAVLALLVGAGFLIVKKITSRPAAPESTAVNELTNDWADNLSQENASSTPTLPDLNAPTTASSTAGAAFSDLAIEYLSFADFYKAPNKQVETKLNDYSLPLNVKIDVMNYYDLSRKLNLDPALDDLNNYGFATINNPWTKTAPDFYSIYANLDEKQIPLFISADFIAYYYQEILKKAFKNVEEDVFYDNLWDINKEMYEAAKTRYEARLAAMGNVNDSVLEGERLETAFFAVALELLKPTAGQLAAANSADPNKFSAADADRFYFVVPPYLRDDVLKEEAMIRQAKGTTKSPVLLYSKNYADFTVPVDYRAQAKLNNFYLTTVWLNAVFPLNYRNSHCPDCLLDYADWRINLTAASFMAQDFSSLPELKNKWARVYKVMSFFKGLREELNYVQYRDALTAVFGADYKIDRLFDDTNSEAKANLEKLRNKLLTYNFPAIQGGRDQSQPVEAALLGFRMLAEPFSPNDYLFARLTYPNVGVYQAASLPSDNLTACQVKGAFRRCQGFALDPVNLVFPLGANDYFQVNTDYAGYASAASDLKKELTESGLAHATSYWSTLSLIGAYLEMPKASLPIFSRNEAWNEASLKTAPALWVNWQLPWEEFSLNQLFHGQGLTNLSRWNENSYVEPNLTILNELIATNDMIKAMFNALQLDREAPLALSLLSGAGDNLSLLKDVVVKELRGESLSADDNESVADFTKQLTITPAKAEDKRLTIGFGQQKTGLKEDLSQLELMLVIHQEGESKVLSVGPVWDYIESK